MDPVGGIGLKATWALASGFPFRVTLPETGANFWPPQPAASVRAAARNIERTRMGWISLPTRSVSEDGPIPRLRVGLVLTTRKPALPLIESAAGHHFAARDGREGHENVHADVRGDAVDRTVAKDKING